MQAILIIQIIVSLILIILVTLQSKDSSLGAGFASATQSGYHTKRGPEKMIYLATIIFSAIFLVLSFLNIAFFR